ncbi:hypothetical protein ZWY2020_049049 [Hordeum vulgare]|nr:hypothetical protein ZWY2020_049049 [Hordeum vulgare]
MWRTREIWAWNSMAPRNSVGTDICAPETVVTQSDIAARGRTFWRTTIGHILCYTPETGCIDLIPAPHEVGDDCDKDWEIREMEGNLCVALVDQAAKEVAVLYMAPSDAAADQVNWAWAGQFHAHKMGYHDRTTLLRSQGAAEVVMWDPLEQLILAVDLDGRVTRSIGPLSGGTYYSDFIPYVNSYTDIYRRTTKTSKCLNLGSYDYLGFAGADEYCTPHVIESLKKYGAITCSARVDGGNNKLHTELEELVSRFFGKPAAILFGMGYGTNSVIIPILIGKGGLIVSDSLNHISIVNGARGSGATVRVFQHNNPAHLEYVLREQIAGGQPRTHRPWKKIIVIVEGIYSMEGELCNLPEIMAVCKKYKAACIMRYYYVSILK